MGTGRLEVHFLAEKVDRAALAGADAVVIDVLRAPTTIVEALAAGASEIFICGTVAAAREKARQLGQRAILGGERGGERIDGFDLGNSPAEYVPAAVAGRPVVLTTTNGTRAVLRCEAAAGVWIAGLANATAAAGLLRQCDALHLVCAGTDGHVSHEDVLAAGLMAATAQRLLGEQAALGDAAQSARDAWLTVAAGASGAALTKRVLAALAESPGGRNLTAISMGDDIRFAAVIDRHDFVPRWDPVRGSVVR